VITRQIEHKLLKRGFQFNVMVVGASTHLLQKTLANARTGQTGLGKSTLVNTLFASHLVESKGRIDPDISSRSTTEIHPQSHGMFARVRRATHPHTLPRLERTPFLCVNVVETVETSCLPTVITENGVKLRLNIVDTPGYGDLINNEGCWDPIVKYVS